jgi:hypothetical protein
MNRKQHTTLSPEGPRERPLHTRKKSGGKKEENTLLQQQQQQQQQVDVYSTTSSPLERRDQIIRCATRRVSKKSVARKSPLRFEFSRNSLRGVSSPGMNQEEKRALERVIDRDLTDQERLKEVARQIERARVLPVASLYARHKLEVLAKAKSLLEQRISTQGIVDGDELNRLLEELSIQ